MASRPRNTGEGFIYRLRFPCLCEDNRRDRRGAGAFKLATDRHVVL